MGGAWSPWLRLAHEFRTPVDFALADRRINDHALLYFRQGAGWATVGELTQGIRPGLVLVLRPNTDLHAFRAVPGTDFHMLNLHFDLVERPDSATVPLHQSSGPRPLPTDEILPPASAGGLPAFYQVLRREAYERLFFAALHAFAMDLPCAALRRKAVVLEILALLMEEQSSGDPQADETLALAVAFMHEHCAEHMSLARIAAAAGLGRSRFSDRFRARHGMSPMAWLRRLRIEVAKTELLHLDLPVKAVASRTGFADVHHFTRAFTAQVGIPPAAWRARGGA